MKMLKQKKKKKPQKNNNKKHTQTKIKIIYNISPNQSFGSLNRNIKRELRVIKEALPNVFSVNYIRAIFKRPLKNKVYIICSKFYRK